jgi:hypothetical protein
MEMKQITRNGRTVEYGIDGDQMVFRDPATGKELHRVPLSAFKEEEQVGTRGTNEFKTCMRGCYPLKAGSPGLFFACCAECATLLIP